MDEAHAANVAKKVQPRISVILNVLEDQLDRFVDPALVRETLSSVASNTSEKVLLNADDQNCIQISSALGHESSVGWFGFSDELSSNNELHYAPTYLPQLPKHKPSVTLLSKVGQDVSVEVSGTIVKFKLPSRGAHFALDAVAALSASAEILGNNFNPTLAAGVLNDLPPVFSRGEIKQIDGEFVEFILVQNPPSMQLNIDNIDGEPEQVFFAIGRDVHDPSWLWTVDYSKLKNVSMVSGFNYADAALVLKYNGVNVERVESDYFKAIDEFLALPKPKNGMKTVLYSADAMRRLRRYKGFTDPEDVTRA
jgi:UDP-N-acetylmuramyl tripeptide synthase